jgi:hypothetical protein
LKKGKPAPQLRQAEKTGLSISNDPRLALQFLRHYGWSTGEIMRPSLLPASSADQA